MSIKAKITKELLENSKDMTVHFIPASIDGNGEMKIDEYFNNYQQEENGVLINSLRGYPLKGVEIKLPENLQGVVFRENEQLKIEDAERELKFGGKFDSFTYWNYDRIPTENDAYKKLTHYLKISEALHTEIQSLDDDEEEELKFKKEEKS
ncbi:unnamed protein product [Diamesa serratosioi]